MRKLICLLFVVASAFSIVGCGSGGGSEEAVSDKPVGDVTPSADGGPKAAGGSTSPASVAPEPTPPPASN